MNCTGAIIKAVCYFAAIFSPRAFATSRVGQMKIICRENKTKKKRQERHRRTRFTPSNQARDFRTPNAPPRISSENPGRVANLPELHISLIQKTTGSGDRILERNAGAVRRVTKTTAGPISSCVTLRLAFRLEWGWGGDALSARPGLAWTGPGRPSRAAGHV